MQKRKLHPALKALLAVAITVAVLTGLIFGVLFATSLRPEDYGFDPDWIIGRSKQEIIAHYGGDEKTAVTRYRLNCGSYSNAWITLLGYNPSNNRFCIMYDDNDTAIKCQFEQPFCYSLSYLLSEVGFGTEEYPYDVQWMLGKSLEEIEARYGPTQDCSIVQSWWSTEPFRRYYVDTNVGLLLYFGKEGVMTYCVEEYRSFPESF